MDIVKIVTTFGGPCIYKQAIFSDGSRSGRIQDIGQSDEQLIQELIDSKSTGRDDVKTFVASVVE